MRVIAQSAVSEKSETSATIELNSLSDADLLDAWNRDQHRGALATLIERYSRLVLSVCRRRCRTHADADDAFQTTFLYLARNSHKIRHPERLVGWLHRVAQRAAVATLPSTDRETSPMVEPPATVDDPLDRLAQRHEAIVLDEELAVLPEHYRSAIVMHLYEGQTIEHLAETLETTPGSIRGRLQRGKQILAQRLRRRGVVPVLAYAAAQSWTVNEASAGEATEQLLERIGEDSSLPDPPIETTLLESLLAQGVRLMPSLYTLSGVACGAALITLMLMTTNGSGHAGEGAELTISGNEKPSESTQPVVVTATLPDDADSELAQGVVSGSMGGAGGTMAAGSTGTTVPAQGGGFPGNTMAWAQETKVPDAEGATAEAAREAIDSKIDLKFSGTLRAVAQQLAGSIGVPVLLDERGLAFAQYDVDVLVVNNMEANNIPLRTALRKLLRPVGLKAVVEEEGLVITADNSVLVHKGIGTTRWINLDEDAEGLIAAVLDSETSLELIELPLSELANQLQDQHNIPVALNTRAMEELGISEDEPVTYTGKGMSLRSALKRILSRHDLTYTVSGETLLLTTVEAAEQDLATRIYWLEGTGFAKGDFESIIEAVQSSVVPDTWEALGGPSTIVTLTSSRPAIMVSTLYPIHETLDSFFNAMRETHFGVEPVIENVPVPARPTRGGMGGGMGGGGFF